MKSLIRWGNPVFFAAMIVVNALANILPLGGNTTGEVSADYPTLFTPAPFTFSIWGIIYILMGFFAVYATIMFEEDDTASVIRDDVSFWFILSCVMNIAWIFSWHYRRIGLSTIFILGLLCCLIVINMRFTVQHGICLPERICVYGFNIYLGWICAAAIANISVLLKKANWTGFGLSEQVWTFCILLVVCLLGVAFVICGGRFMASLALLWAVAGIFAKHISRIGHDNAYPLITVTLVCVFLVILLNILLAPFMAQKRSS